MSGVLRDALRAEWVKLRTSAGFGWMLGGVVALTTVVSGLAVAAVTYRARTNQDPTKLSLTGVQAGQALVAVLAILTISGEYSSRMIHTTLVAVPRRGAVLAAKVTVLAGVVTAAGAVAVAGSLLAGRLLLPGNGFTTGRGFPALSPADGVTLRAGCGSVFYLVLIALLSLGIATATRDAASAVGVVFGLLYLFPVVADAITDRDWQRHLRQVAPMDAGLAIQATTHLRDLPIAPWPGLGALTAWALASLGSGALLLHRRDA